MKKAPRRLFCCYREVKTRCDVAPNEGDMLTPHQQDSALHVLRVGELIEQRQLFDIVGLRQLLQIVT